MDGPLMKKIKKLQEACLQDQKLLQNNYPDDPYNQGKLHAFKQINKALAKITTEIGAILTEVYEQQQEERDIKEEMKAPSPTKCKDCGCLIMKFCGYGTHENKCFNCNQEDIHAKNNQLKKTLSGLDDAPLWDES